MADASELVGRMLAIGTNALASSIVLALRPRSDGAPTTDRRGFIAALQTSCPTRCASCSRARSRRSTCRRPRSAPAWRCSRRYAKVIENDGTAMTVRSALARINEILDQVLNEQEGDFDATTRFAIAWYRQHGYDAGASGSPTTSREPETPRSAAMAASWDPHGRRGQGHAAFPDRLMLETMTRSRTRTSAPGRCSTT